MNNDSNSKNYKIVYKKLINYDNDSSSMYSELDNQINLNNSNEHLRNNILKEINSDKQLNTEKLDINKNFSVNIKKFVKYLKVKNIDLTKLNEQNILSNSIKLFIIENNLNEHDTFVFLKELKLILDNNANTNDNIEINDNILEEFENLLIDNNLCFRCYRKSHYTYNCYAKITITGDKIEDSSDEEKRSRHSRYRMCFSQQQYFNLII